MADIDGIIALYPDLLPCSFAISLRHLLLPPHLFHFLLIYFVAWVPPLLFYPLSFSDAVSSGCRSGIYPELSRIALWFTSPRGCIHLSAPWRETRL
ncbi:hypothetical protein BJX70DRAFT_45319 [Aspergillus crustosus]